MIGALGAGVVAGLGIAMPVGAIGTYLVGLGARAPRRVATAAALGVASTDGLYALVAVAGGAALVDVLRPASDWLQALSVVALVALAVVTVIAGVRRYRRDDDAPAELRVAARPAHAYLALLGLTALNPATLAYFTALVLGFQADSAVSGPQRAVFVAAVFAASAAWQLLLVATGAGLGHLAGGRRGQVAIAIASGAVMLALAAHIAM
ncbi:MAG TPA: LysE family transporter [Jatrophihabitantaceae bacterium]|nr:LysE family transporter [Jatrophihabitantaceae bacterium]